jgi:hypothetical protein
MSASDEEYTPPEVWRIVLLSLGVEAFDLDPCSSPLATVPARRKVMLPDDGLQTDWSGKLVWCNPPYSNPYPWVEKLAQNRGVLLVTGDTSTVMWRDIIWERAHTVVFWYGRMRFRSPYAPARKTTAKRSSALAFFGDILLDLAPLRRWGKVIELCP